MIPPTKEDFKSYQHSDSAATIYSSARNETNPRKALEKFAELITLGKTYILKCEAAEYSPSTGEPIRFHWVPSLAWDRNLWLSGVGMIFLGLDKKDLAYSPLLEYLSIHNITIIEISDRKFTATYVGASGTRDGTVSHHIEFAEVI